MNIQKNWDVFISYSNKKNRINQTKVINIRNYLVSHLHITTWIDVVELKSGQLSKKVFEGIVNSHLFLCFISEEYSDDKDRTNELCLAKKIGKEIIFFINEDTTGMDQETITKNIIKEIAFYIGKAPFYIKKEDLLENVRKSLVTLGAIKLNKRPSILIGHHSFFSELVKKFAERFSSIFDAQFISYCADNYANGQLDSADAFIVLLNTIYVDNKFCMNYFERIVELAQQKPLVIFNIETNFATDAFINNENISILNAKNCDFEKLTLGEGTIFVQLVYWLQNKLPKALIPETKPIDYLILISKSQMHKIDKLRFKSKIVKYSHPSDILKPNFKSIKETKAVILVIDDETNKSEKIIEEIKFANKIDVPILIINDKSVEHLNISITKLLRGMEKSCYFQNDDAFKSKISLRKMNKSIKKLARKNNNQIELNANDAQIELLGINKEVFEREKQINDIENTIIKIRFFSLIFLSIMFIGAAISLSLSILKFSTYYYEPTQKTTTTTTKKPLIEFNITSPQIPKNFSNLIVNSCVGSFNFSDNYFDPSYKFAQQRILNISFEAKLLAIAEVCLPETYFYLVSQKDVRIINERGEVQLVMKQYVDYYKIMSITATKHEILICDCIKLYIYTFSLALLKTVKVTTNEFTPESVIAILLSPIFNLIYLPMQTGDVLILNDQFEVINNFRISEKRIQYAAIGADNSIYYIINSKKILRYYLGNSTMISSPCEILNWFLVDGNQRFLSSCFSKYAPNEIYFHDSKGEIYNLLSYDTPPMAFLDAKSRLFVALYEQVIIY